MKTERIHLRVSPELKAEIETEAKEYALPVSLYLIWIFKAAQAMKGDRRTHAPSCHLGQKCGEPSNCPE